MQPTSMNPEMAPISDPFGSLMDESASKIISLYLQIWQTFDIHQKHLKCARIFLLYFLGLSLYVLQYFPFPVCH